MILTIAVTAIALALATPAGLDGAESDLWTTHSAPDPVAAGWPFTVTVGYGNNGPDPATSAFVNSYFTAPMGLDVFIDDLIFGSGLLYDTIQASAQGTDTLGNAPVLYWDDYFCEELLFQLQRNDGDPNADPIEGLDPGVSAGFSYDITIPMDAPSLGTVEILEPAPLARVWRPSNSASFFTLQASAHSTYGRGGCDPLVGDICQFIDDNCFSGRISLLDAPIEADWEIVDDGSADPTFGCDPLIGFTPGHIAVIRRGACEFGQKAFNAEQAGAVAAVIVNSDQCADFPASDQCVIAMGAGGLGGLVTIPFIMLAQADGEPVITAIEGGQTVHGVFGGVSQFSADGYVFLRDLADTDPDDGNDASRWAAEVYGVGCNFDLDPPSRGFPPAGGNGTVTITTGAECRWLGATEASWITLVPPATGTGSGFLDYQADVNPGGGRSAVVRIGSGVHLVTQEAGNGCSYTILPATANFPGAGGIGTIDVATQPGCEWSATASVDWLSLTSPSGVGSGSVGYTVEPNAASPRAGAIPVADGVHTVSQGLQAGCDSGYIADDGAPDNHYGWGVGHTFVQRFTPEGYPHHITGLCTTFTRTDIDDELDYWVVMYDDDGPGGGPGTVLTIKPESIGPVPEWPGVVFDPVDLEGMVPAITEGSVYLGIGWQDSSEIGFSVVADESPTTPQQTGYYFAGTSPWEEISSAFPDYRSLMVRSEGFSSVDGDWIQVVGGEVGGGGGFGDPDNSAIPALAAFSGALFAGTARVGGPEVYYTLDGDQWLDGDSGGVGFPTTLAVTDLIEFNGQLYAGTADTTVGAGLFRTGFPPDWSQVAGNGFGDADNRSISSSIVFNGELYVGTGNNSGCEVWRSPDGSAWTQVIANGFGNPQHTGALSMAVFQDQIWVGTSTDTTSAEVWRSPDGVIWTRAAEPGWGDPGNTIINALAVFDAALYAGVSNETTGAQVWRTFDGVTWEQVVDRGFGDPRLEDITHLQVDGRRLLALVTGSPPVAASVWTSRDGVVWWPASSPGFRDPANTWLYSIAAWNDGLYTGSMNVDGGEVWSTLRQSIFADGFESGDTGGWSRAVP
jgi:hypothetical protein